MQQSHDSVEMYVAKVAAYVLAWLASWTLGEVQQAAGIFSALAIGVVALINGYLAIRNQARREVRAVRDGDEPTAPGGLR